MPSDLSSYLATHYLTTDSKPTKKRKRKHTTDSNNAGLLITDDDDAGWTRPSRPGDDDDDDADNPVNVAGTSAEFRRAKKSGWKTVGAPVPAFSQTKDGRDANDDSVAADAILASTAAENAAAGAPDDEAPVVEGGGRDAQDAQRKAAMMSDGTHAGLQSAAAISAQLQRRQQEEREELEALNRERKARAKRKGVAGEDGEDEEEQLVLRDATGRRVDVAMRRAEARRAAVDAEELARREEAARKRALKGDVQLEQARERRERLEDAAVMPLARGKDDEEMNAELKAQSRWNDPMAQFLGGDDTRARGAKSGKKGAKSGRPVYKGAAPPNRYGIRPGYRWDGVDRSNGFEGERFKAINRRERNKGLDYSWQMDE